MTSDQFETTMREYLRRNPFEPFVVRTDSNQLIIIDKPQAVALAAGGAGYLGAEQIHFIESSNVLEIRALNTQAAP
jgi:hypothetical protein